MRQSVQRLVLLELGNDYNPYQQAWQLSQRSTGFMLSDADVVSLLYCLDPSNSEDERWRDVVQLIRHDGNAGAEVRAAARLFASLRPDLLAWIDKLAEQTIPDWQVEQAERERERYEKQVAAHIVHRNHFASCTEQMRAGDYGSIISPAQAYLGLFNDIGKDVPAHERVGQWLGGDIGELAHLGFEAFMMLDPPEPTAQQIAMSNAKGRSYSAGYIIVAALAERLRNGTGFDDLSDERLMAGLFELRCTPIEKHAGIIGLQDALKAAIQARGIWEEAMRLYHEPQLQERREHVDGLYALMRDKAHVSIGIKLAAEWLERFLDLPIDPELELVDRLIRSKRFEELRRALLLRSTLADEERRRNWDAVGFIVDFPGTVARLGANPIEPELLWHIRHRISDRTSENTSILLNVPQSEWIIDKFRLLWPMVERPSGVSSGDSNPWDASNFIVYLIRRLGNDSSEEAIGALLRLRGTPDDSYSESVKIVIAEQKRIRVEAAYNPPTLAAIDAIARSLAPISLVDLQTVVLEELAIVQAKIKSDDAESWRGFYDDKKVPFSEERCRDHLLGLLRQGAEGLIFDPETHVAADKEVDITCSVGTLRIPIEIKGQWHSELWKGADIQLDTFYTRDWRAEECGIYLVFWFGDQQQKNKKLKSRGLHKALPTTADELKEMLVATNSSTQEGRIAIFVLDLVRCFPN
ncbi:hypothetical protein [Pseudomonas capsici]|uniref:hypothetical protein n=1 Tax=Pseudomonas capsici TaxID=2810614 RepID=UPI001E4BCCD2|nr:hypothetical protein [Pseudomonas capsici]